MGLGCVAGGFCGFCDPAAGLCDDAVLDGCEDDGDGADDVDCGVAAGCEDAGELAVIDGSACAAVAALGDALDAASVFGVDEDPAIPAAYAVMCVRTSINFARVASSIALGDFVLPLVPVAPGVDVGAPADVSLPTISVMILSTAATSVPQLLLLFFVAFVDLFAVPPVGCVVLALGDEPIFSRLLKCRFRSAICDRFFAGTEAAEIPLTACCA